jgi:flagellar hook-associated protein 3 FlgL
MVSTLSTLGQNNLLRTEFTSLQGQIQNLQTQIGTGEVAQVIGDLGAQSSLDISLRQQVDQVDTLNKGISQLQVRTGLVDKSLSIINDTALAVQNQAFAQPQFAPQRLALVSAAQAAIDQINSQLQTSVNGRSLFGGTQTQTNPIVPQTTLLPAVQAAVTAALAGAPPSVPAAVQAAVAGAVTPATYYTGGPPNQPTQIDHGLSINDSITAADPAFQQILAGLYTLASLPQPVGAVAVPPAITDAQFDATAQAAATQISGGLSELQGLTEKNGQNEKLLTDVSTSQGTVLTTLQTQIDNIENVNVADATTRLSQLKLQLDASYHIIADLSSLSLVDFLK